MDSSIMSDRITYKYADDARPVVNLSISRAKSCGQYGPLLTKESFSVYLIRKGEGIGKVSKMENALEALNGEERRRREHQ